MTDEKLDQILKQALAPEISDKEIRIYRRRKDKMNKFGKIGKCVAATVAATVIGIGGLGYFNPVLAAKIPLIGKIFEKVEDDATYSGDYTDKITVLTNEDSAGNLDTSDYTVSDKGITLTASEVYCDGYSIFLAVNIESEDADFTHIPKHYTGMNAADNRTAAGFYFLHALQHLLYLNHQYKYLYHILNHLLFLLLVFHIFFHYFLYTVLH